MLRDSSVYTAMLAEPPRYPSRRAYQMMESGSDGALSNDAFATASCESYAPHLGAQRQFARESPRKETA
jgi:hypothetical protein